MADFSTVAGPTAVEIMTPAWTSAGPISKLLSFTATKGELDQQTVEFTADWADDVFSQLYAYGGIGGGETARESMMDQWGVRFWYHDQVWLETIAGPWKDKDVPGGGINVSLVCQGGADFALRSRKVMTTDLTRYDTASTYSISNYVVDLITKNFNDASRPTLYAAEGVHRWDLGNYEVTAVAIGTHPTTVGPNDVRISHGTNLEQAVRDLCRQYGLGLKAVIGSIGPNGKTLIEIQVIYPGIRERLVGADRREFSRDNNTLLVMERMYDPTAAATMFEVTGQNARVHQKVGYIYDAVSGARRGTWEDGELWPEAREKEITREKGFLLAQKAGVPVAYNMQLAEGPDLRLGIDFDVEDLCPFVDSRRGIAFDDVIRVASVKSGSPHARVRIRAGRIPYQDTPMGGKWSHQLTDRRAGEIPSFRHICADYGELWADEPQDVLQTIGDPNNPSGGTYVVAVNGANQEKTTDQLLFGVCNREIAPPPSEYTICEGDLKFCPKPGQLELKCDTATNMEAKCFDVEIPYGGSFMDAVFFLEGNMEIGRLVCTGGGGAGPGRGLVATT